MDQLSQHLRGEFHARQQQVSVTYELVGNVLPTFVSFFSGDGRAWPYELKDRKMPRSGGYSVSTNAMILFAIASTLGQPQKSILLPALRKRSNFETVTGQVGIKRDEVQEVYASGYRRLMEALTTPRSIGRTKATYLTESGTYGYDDPFTLIWVMELLRVFPPDGVDAATVQQVKENVSAAAKRALNRMSPANGEPLNWRKESGKKATPWGPRHALDHAFVKLRGSQLLRSLELPSSDELWKLEREFAQFFEQRLEQHLSYHMVPDSRFDPAELAFCLEGALLHNRYYLGGNVVDRAFKVLSECQETNPYWRPLTPFIGSERGMALFPISVEVANSLIRVCNQLDGDILQETRFGSFAPNFQRYATWLQARVVRGRSADGKNFVGWHSEHISEVGTVHLWETSQVVLYLMHYAALLSEQAARSALVVSQFAIKEPSRVASADGRPSQSINLSRWKRAEDEKEPLHGAVKEGSTYRVFEQIRRFYLEGRLAGKGGEHYTMLLYGPPGTGKTGLCEDLAAALGWRLITITVSDFLAGGAAEVEARAKAIFDVLGEQTDRVILMDEIDNFLLNREGGRYQGQEGIFQFMTPGMLTKLKSLRDKAASVLIIATNYAERIDNAIKRRGRIDDHLLLLPPASSRRREILNARIEKERLRGRVNIRLAELLTDDIETLVRESVLFGYGELRELVENAVARVDADSSATQVASALKNQLSEVSPAITLASYRQRLAKNEDDPEQPLEEFLLLVFLVAESRRALKEDERDLLLSAIDLLECKGKLTKLEMIDKIKRIGHVRDDDIASKLVDALSAWNLVTVGA